MGPTNTSVKYFPELLTDDEICDLQEISYAPPIIIGPVVPQKSPLRELIKIKLEFFCAEFRQNYNLESFSFKHTKIGWNWIFKLPQKILAATKARMQWIEFKIGGNWNSPISTSYSESAYWIYVVGCRSFYWKVILLAEST